jgi:hypothetical protein
MGTPIEGKPPIYVGMYVDDIIYFCAIDDVERKFEDLLSAIGNVDFMGQVPLFHGIEFTWLHHSDGHLTVVLTQQSFVENLILSLGFENIDQSTILSPYNFDLSINSILHELMPSTDWDNLCLWYQSLAGSLKWLAHTT